MCLYVLSDGQYLLYLYYNSVNYGSKYSIQEILVVSEEFGEQNCRFLAVVVVMTGVTEGLSAGSVNTPFCYAGV